MNKNLSPSYSATKFTPLAPYDIKKKPADWHDNKVFAQLQNILTWLSEDNSRWDLDEYCQITGLSPLWILKIIESADIGGKHIHSAALAKEIRMLIIRRKLRLAQKGKLNIAGVIFELKARHGWRDGGEKHNPLQINVFQNMSETELRGKIANLMNKHEKQIARDKRVTAKGDSSPIETTFEEIRSKICGNVQQSSSAGT